MKGRFSIAIGIMIFLWSAIISCTLAGGSVNKEIISVAEEIHLCHAGDTLIVKDYYMKDIHFQDVGIYHGGKIESNEHLAILK